MSSIPFTYGSDQSGLVWAYQFAPERVALPLQSNEVADFFNKSNALAKHEFLWLHFNLSQSSTENGCVKTRVCRQSFSRHCIRARVLPASS